MSANANIEQTVWNILGIRDPQQLETWLYGAIAELAEARSSAGDERVVKGLRVPDGFTLTPVGDRDTAFILHHVATGLGWSLTYTTFTRRELEELALFREEMERIDRSRHPMRYAEQADGASPA